MKLNHIAIQQMQILDNNKDRKVVKSNNIINFASTMKIGNIEFGDRPVFPGTDGRCDGHRFPYLYKRFGASMVYTEFVSAEALGTFYQRYIIKLTISDEERPVGIQIYGRDVESMVEAAKIWKPVLMW